MSFIMGQCPECKKILPIDERQKKWICGYCGGKFSVSYAVNKLNAISGDRNYISSDFVINCGEILKYTGTNTNVIIPEGITIIGETVFKDLAIADVYLPESLKIIKSSAFYNCKALESVVFPKGIKSIGSCAFDGCISLENLIIPESVKFIGEYAFGSCTSLEYIIIPKSVLYIEENVFSECFSLLHAKVPIKFKDYDIFYKCPKVEIEYY